MASINSVSSDLEKLLQSALATAGAFSNDTIFVELWTLDSFSNKGARLVRPPCGVWLDENQLRLLQSAGYGEESGDELLFYDPYCIYGHDEQNEFNEDDTIATDLDEGENEVQQDNNSPACITCPIGAGIAGCLFSDSSNNHVSWRQVLSMAIDPFIMDREDKQLKKLLTLIHCQGESGNYASQSISTIGQDFHCAGKLEQIRKKAGQIPESVDWVGGVQICFSDGKENGIGIVLFAARSTAIFNELRSKCNKSFMIEMSNLIAEIWSLTLKVSLGVPVDQLQPTESVTATNHRTRTNEFFPEIKTRIDEIQLRMRYLCDQKLNGEVCLSRRKHNTSVNVNESSTLLQKMSSLFRLSTS